MPQGEKASMQGFEMLLYGTESRLYDEDAQKWVVGSQGFIDALEFLRTVFEEELTLSLGQNLDPNIGVSIYRQILPDVWHGMVIVGYVDFRTWISDAPNPWPS